MDSNGSGYILIFKPQNAEREIEIGVLDYAFKKLRIRRGSEATITLRHEIIFIVKGNI